MSAGLVFVVFLLGTLAYGLYQFARAERKTPDAIQTTVYIIAYPVAVYLLWLSRPLPSWVVAPVIVAGVPWIVAGIHLNEIVKDPSVAKPNQLVGFPYRFWILGGLLSVALSGC